MQSKSKGLKKVKSSCLAIYYLLVKTLFSKKVYVGSKKGLRKPSWKKGFSRKDGFNLLLLGTHHARAIKRIINALPIFQVLILR